MQSRLHHLIRELMRIDISWGNDYISSVLSLDLRSFKNKDNLKDGEFKYRAKYDRQISQASYI